MAYSTETLQLIFDKTAGRCHLCREGLVASNYGRCGERGAWEVDHSKPRANGGTDHRNNLFPACISCNRSKQHGSSRAVRAANGVRGVPMSEAQIADARADNALGGGLIGLGLGFLFGGGPLIVGLSVVGALVGAATDPEEN